MSSYLTRILRRSVKGVLRGTTPKRKTGRVAGATYVPVLQRTNIGILQGSCVSCGRVGNIYVHMSPSGQSIQATCSHCDGLLCTKCYSRSYYDIGTPIFQHICRLYRMVPYSTTSGSMWLLCENCKKEIGIRETKSKATAQNKRDISLNLDKFVERADAKYRQSGRFEELAQLYELCGLHNLAEEARMRR